MLVIIILILKLQENELDFLILLLCTCSKDNILINFLLYEENEHVCFTQKVLRLDIKTKEVRAKLVKPLGIMPRTWYQSHPTKDLGK